MDHIARLREHLTGRDMRASTHWEGCIDSHPICALAWALDQIEYLESEIESLKCELMLKHWVPADD